MLLSVKSIAIRIIAAVVGLFDQPPTALCILYFVFWNLEFGISMACTSCADAVTGYRNDHWRMRAGLSAPIFFVKNKKGFTLLSLTRRLPLFLCKSKISKNYKNAVPTYFTLLTLLFEKQIICNITHTYQPA